MNRIGILIGFFLLCGAGKAQVYTIEPLYECKTIQLKSGGEIELYKIDQNINHSIVT